MEQTKAISVRRPFLFLEFLRIYYRHVEFTVTNKTLVNSVSNSSVQIGYQPLT